MHTEFIKLFIAFREHPLYPKRSFTKYEAFLDLLVSSYPTGEVSTVRECGNRWKWPLTKTWKFFNTLVEMDLLSKRKHTFSIKKSAKWYDSEAPKALEQFNTAGQVVNLYNELTGRKVSMNAAKRKLIIARIREGAAMKPPVGLAQFEAVFKHKQKEWTGSDMEKHLEIETLCAEKHFFKYLDQARDAFRKGDTTKLQTQAFTV
jgi:uncharacterized phage protein (TIGR02220 family)